jgi:hypothetical protein
MEEKALVMPKSQRERVKERRETSLLAKVREPFLRAAHWQAATTLFRYLHHAYKAGIPLEDAVASFGPAHPFLSRFIQAPLQRALVQPNMPLSEMLADIGGDISPAVQALLRAGERHGRWEVVLEALREHAEQEREFSLKRCASLFVRQRGRDGVASIGGRGVRHPDEPFSVTPQVAAGFSGNPLGAEEIAPLACHRVEPFAIGEGAKLGALRPHFGRAAESRRASFGSVGSRC